MKKNTLTRSASILFALALVTTSIVSGTYAKYVTEDSTKDTARVAKWGVLISAEGNLFSDAYEKANANTPTAYNTANITSKDITVASTSGDARDSLVAPGTQSSGDGLTLQITGAPEVTTQLDITVKAQDIYLAAGTYATLQPVTVNAASFSTKVDAGLYTVSDKTVTKVTDKTSYNGTTQYYVPLSKVTVAEDGYYPVKYTYTNTNNSANNAKLTKATEIADAIADLVKASSDTNTASTAIAELTATETYAANTDFSATTNFGVNQITWKWDFEKYILTSDTTFVAGTDYYITNDGGTTFNKATVVTGSSVTASTYYVVDKDVDNKDTILGNLMASKIDTADNIKVASLNGNSGTVLTVDENDIVKNGDNEVGSVRTYLDITVTATQVD